MKKTISKSDIQHYNSPIDETNIYDSLALVKRAKGSKIWIEGKIEPYYDLIMAYSSTNFGHVNTDILKFVKRSICKFDNVVGFNSSSKIELSKKLISSLPHPGNKIVYFPVGGAKAIDAAIKLAKAFTKKDTIIAFQGAFHGYSYAAMSVTDDEYIEKKQFGSFPGKVVQFPFPNRLDLNDKSKSILSRIESFLIEENQNVAAIIFEPIQGAAGFIIPPAGFISELVKVARKYKVISICDEIQTGICRTGTIYYLNQLDIDPDIVLLGKSLAGGFYPLSAVIANKDLHEAVNIKHSGFDSTFATNLLAIDIANCLFDHIQNNHIPDLVFERGQVVFKKLENLFKRYPFIKELDHIGMAFAYKIEAKSGEVEHAATLANRIKMLAFEKHLILQTAGTKADHMKISPNFFITDTEIEIIVEKLEKVLDDTLSFYESENTRII